MTSALELLEPARRPAAGSEGRCSPGGSRLTLEQRISGVWEGLLTAGTAACPACHEGCMERVGDEGRCTACRATLT